MGVNPRQMLIEMLRSLQVGISASIHELVRQERDQQFREAQEAKGLIPAAEAPTSPGGRTP